MNHRVAAVVAALVVAAVWAIAPQRDPGAHRSIIVSPGYGPSAPTAADEGHVDPWRSTSPRPSSTDAPERRPSPRAARAGSDERPRKTDPNRRPSPAASTENGASTARSRIQPPASAARQAAEKSAAAPAARTTPSSSAAPATTTQSPRASMDLAAGGTAGSTAPSEGGHGSVNQGGSVGGPTGDVEGVAAERRGPDANAAPGPTSAPAAALPGTATPPVSPPPSRPGSEAAPVLLAPRPLTQSRPGYPEPLLTIERNGMSATARLIAPQGRMRLRLMVRADGTVGTVDVLSSTGSPELDAAAVAALSRWRFAPATRDGVPIDAYYTLWVSFRLE